MLLKETTTNSISEVNIVQFLFIWQSIIKAENAKVAELPNVSCNSTQKQSEHINLAHFNL